MEEIHGNGRNRLSLLKDHISCPSMASIRTRLVYRASTGRNVLEDLGDVEVGEIGEPYGIVVLPEKIA